MEALASGAVDFPSSLTVEAVTLPVSFEACFQSLQEKIDAFNPDVVIAFGQAAGRDSIELETLAVNKLHAEIADNQGYRPEHQLISQEGAPSYLSSLPVAGIEGALLRAGLPVRQSKTAGTFVCNYLFYRLMETNQDTLRLCGFIHVPLLPEQARSEEPHLCFEDLKRALSVILHYIEY